MNGSPDHTFCLHSLVLIVHHCSWKLFCLWLVFFPVTKLRGKGFFLSHYRNLCPFYWEKPVSDSKSTWSIFEDIYVNICMWLLPKQKLPLSQKKNYIKLWLPDEKGSLKFVFIMLTDHCKIYIMFLMPWKFRGIFTIGNNCLKGYVWRMQRIAAKLSEEL